MVDRNFDIEALLSTSHYVVPGRVIGNPKESNRNTTGVWWKRWLYNITANYPRIKEMEFLNSLYGQWNNEPVIIVGGGPSLKKNITLVRHAKENGWRIVAVDAVFNKLKSFGIKPDLTMSLDAGEFVVDFFDEQYIEEDDVFAFAATTDPRVYKKLENSKVYPFASYNPFNEVWDDVLGPKYGNSLYAAISGTIVTTSAADMCLWMGCNPIVTIGNDLRYKNLKDVHEDHTALNLHERCMGGWTIRPFKLAAAVLSFLALKYPDGNLVKDNVQWIDCSGGMVEDWQKLPLKATIKKYTRSMEGVK